MTNMKQKITLLLFIISLLSWNGNAQTQFWSDTFEDTGAPSSGTRTPSIAEFFCGAPASTYFGRTDLGGISLQSGTYSGFEGTKFWAAEDIDRGPTCTNLSVSPNQQVTWSGINISGKNGLTFKGLFAANHLNANNWEGTSFADPDFVAVEYRIDGGAWVTGIAFYASGTSNTQTLKQDINGDMIGEGQDLTYAFTEFTVNIAGTGTTLDLRLNASINGGVEEIAVDNFRLLEVSCTAPTVPTLAATVNPVCNGASTTLNITGTLNDATQWAIYTGSCGGSLVGTTASSTFVVSPTGSSTTYYVRGEGGCVTPGTCGSITINVNPALTASISSQTNVACNGGTNGAATVTPSGGTSPYTYSWSPSGITTATATGLAAGTYTVIVTDANNCDASTSVTITEPATTLSLTASSQTNVACNGGANGAAAVNTATGGAGGYTYNWTPGNPTGDGTPSVTGLTAGTWTCTVTDVNGCTASQNFTITQPTALSLTPSSQTNVACNGGANGAAAVNTATGGVGPYTYNWTPGNPTGDGTPSVTGLTAGTWTCTVTDANACTTSVNFTISQPTALALTPSSQTNVACNGGSNGAATVNTATGGAGGYTYNWTPGNPTGDGTPSVTGLTAGTWTCTVTDANACTTSVNFTITQPTALSLTPSSQTNVACNGGSNGAATVNTATGGAGGYTYNWTPGNPTGDGTPSVTGLSAGTWTCTVTDANACTTSVNFTITQPTALSLTPSSQTNVACNGGANGAAAVNTATGGAGGYTYNWTPGNPTGDGTPSVTGLTAGTWTCTVTDANACTTSVNFTISQPTAIDNTISENTTGILTANATDAGMTYQWYECPNTLLTGETNQDFTPSSLGDYKVSITFNGCSVESACYTVTTLDTKVFENETEFTMYPNPTNGLVVIKTNTSGEFVIVNQLGQTMKTFTLNSNIENNINVENLADGIYFIKGKSSNQIKAQRLIIKK